MAKNNDLNSLENGHMAYIEDTFVSQYVSDYKNIREIQPPVTKLTEFKRLAINIYRRYFKKYYLFRKVALFFYGYLLPFFVEYVYPYYGKSRRLRPLVKMLSYADQHNLDIFMLSEASCIEIPKPDIAPIMEESNLLFLKSTYTFPKLYVAKINNGTVYGGTNFVLMDDTVLCHELYDFTHDYTSEELHRRVIIKPKLSIMRWLEHDMTPEYVESAASFVDACALNYAHWITEVLPKISVFCNEEKFINIPIVVNYGLHKNIIESLLSVVGNKRQIIMLPIGRALKVGCLYATSAVGYVPFDQRTKYSTESSHGIFSSFALNNLRDTVSAKYNQKLDDKMPAKIYIRRCSGARKLINSDALEKLVVSRGYQIVEPENLTFEQQYHYFKNAKYILSPTGAALASAVFCKPGTEVIVLMGQHKNMIYRYWCNMLAPLKIKVSYVLGEITANKNLGIHGDFVVNVADVECLLDLVENK